MINLSAIKKNIIYNVPIYMSAIKLVYKILLYSPFKRINIICLTEHLGDIVAATPIIDYVRENEFGKIIYITKQNYKDVLIADPSIDKIILVETLSQWIVAKSFLVRQKNIKIFDLHISGKKCVKFDKLVTNTSGINMFNYFEGRNLLSAFLLSTGIELFDIHPRLFFSKEHLMCQKELTAKNKYVVVHVHSNEAGKDWDNLKWVQLIKYIYQKYDIRIIEIGFKSDLGILNSEGYKNDCGLLSINEIMNLITEALFFIGIDSSFAHFANALGTPFIALLGSFGLFDKYLPYSGEMKKNEIVYSDEGPARCISSIQVEDAINFILVKNNIL